MDQNRDNDNINGTPDEQDTLLNNDEVIKEAIPVNDSDNGIDWSPATDADPLGDSPVTVEGSFNEPSAEIDSAQSEVDATTESISYEPASSSVYEDYLHGRSRQSAQSNTDSNTQGNGDYTAFGNTADNSSNVSGNNSYGFTQHADGYFDYQSRKNNQEYSKAKKSVGSKFAIFACVLAVLCVAAIVGFGAWGLSSRVTSGGSNQQNDATQSDSQKADGKDNVNNYILKGNIPESGPLTVPQIVSKCTNSVVAVVVDSGSLGSGFFIDEDGTIITNNHVVEGGTKFQIITLDGTKYDDVTLVGADAQSDIAVLKINSNNKFPAMELGQSDNLVVGQSVIAIGNPYGLELQNTVTNGIISAIRENITLGDFTSDLIQVTAAVNSGNSGGPLIDEYGRVIGVVNIKIAGSTSEGLGFAIPISTATTIASSLTTQGYVSRPMVGIQGYYVDPDKARYENLPTGILIAKITPGSDADVKGIKIGDVITKINGQTFTSMDEFNVIKNKFEIGDSINLTVYRDGIYTDYKIVLKDQKG